MRTLFSIVTLLTIALLITPQAFTQTTTDKTKDAVKKDEKNKEQADPQQLMRDAAKKSRAGDVDGAIELIRQARELDAKNPQLGMSLVGALQQMGIQASRSERKAGNKYFFEAGKIAIELLDADKKPPAAYRGALTIAIYNQACSYGVERKPKKAIKSLERALTEGFTDFDQIAKDEDFAAIRDKDEFKQLVAKHHEAYRRGLADVVAKEMLAHKKYGFSFKLPRVDGGTISSTSFKGKVLIADIWGTWCPPCRAEIPHFIKLREKYGENGLEIVGLNYERGGDEASQIRKIKTFMEEYEMNYNCVLGDKETRDQVPNFRGYPTTVFIDRRGEVRLTLVGLQPYDKLEAIVKMLLDE